MTVANGGVGVVQLTFITAVAPYHTHLVPVIRAQVDQQTISCAHMVIEDHERRGPGAARNAGLAQVTSEFVAFLDADDTIAPTWAEETLAAFEASGGRRYIYTDHLQDGKRIEAPKCAWTNRTWHVITALLPTAWAREAGGFDTSLPAFEDTDFYERLLSMGYCGKRLPRPLFEYGAGGERSAAHHGTPVYAAVMRYFTKNYGGRNVGSCCGDPQPGDLVAVGEHLDGDVMAEAAWAGNRPQRGRATGRIYRTGNWKRTWVDPRDIDVQPELWNIVREAGTPPDFDFASFADYAQKTGDNGGAILTSVDSISDFIMREIGKPEDFPPPPVAINVETPPSGERPSATTLREKAARAKGNRRQPPRNLAAKTGM